MFGFLKVIFEISIESQDFLDKFEISKSQKKVGQEPFLSFLLEIHLQTYDFASNKK